MTVILTFALIALIACFAWAVVASVAAAEWKQRADTPCAECAAWRALRVAEARVREAGRRAEELRQR